MAKTQRGENLNMNVVNEGALIRYYEWDAIPEKFIPFLEKEMADPASGIHQSSGAFWNREDSVTYTDIVRFKVDSDRNSLDFTYGDDVFGAAPQAESRHYQFKGFGAGNGFSEYPASTAPSLPLRIYSFYKEGSKKLDQFQSGLTEWGTLNIIICSQTFYDVVTAYDPSIPADRWYKVILNSRGERDVGEMYLFDPPVNESLVDFDASVLSWRHMHESVFAKEQWVCRASVPAFFPDEAVSIARYGRPQSWCIAKNLYDELLSRGVQGIEPPPEKLPMRFQRK